ncbi:MAG: hypothetical protein U5N86_05335 [Planctomycetota bacterium]|nr:hypothetical protein [Planctomycetota bacterium]
MRTVSIENLERRKKATVVKVNDLALLAIILAAGAMIRFLLMSHHGYVIDISDFFLRWTKELQEKPFTNVYGGLDVDYPPFYLYILYIMGKVGDLLGIPLDTPSSFAVTTAQRFLMKYPALMADMGLGILTWFVARRHFRSTASLTAVVLVIFNPALIYNSAVWGQVDSLLCLFICWTLYLLVTRRFLAATVLYALALTFKPQVLFLLPVFGTALLLNSQYWKFILSLPIFTGVIYIVTKPFTMAWNPVTVISNYLEMIIGAEGKYKMLSMNMWNIWNVVGRAIPREITSQMEDGLKDTMPVIPIPGSEFAAALPSFHTVGIVLITLASLFTVIIMIRRRDEGSIFLAAAFIYLAVCLLGTRMHERYPLPAVMLLVFAGMYYRPVRPLYFLLTVLHLINLHYVLSGFLVSCQSKGLAYNPIKVFNDFAGSPFVMYLSTIFFFSSLLLMGVWLYHIAFRAEKVEEGYQETIPNGFILSLWGDITNNHDLKGILNRVAGRAGFLRGLLAQYVAPVKYNPRGLDWYEATFDLIVSPRRILQKREKSLDDESEPKPEVETTALDQWLSERGYKRLLSVYRKLEKWADKAWPYFSPVWTVFAVVWSYIRRVFNWIFSGFDNSLPLNRFTVGDFKILGFLFLCAFVLFFYNYTSPPYLYFDEEYFAQDGLPVRTPRTAVSERGIPVGDHAPASG